MNIRCVILGGLNIHRNISCIHVSRLNIQMKIKCVLVGRLNIHMNIRCIHFGRLNIHVNIKPDLVCRLNIHMKIRCVRILSNCRNSLECHFDIRSKFLNWNDIKEYFQLQPRALPVVTVQAKPLIGATYVPPYCFN